MAPRLSVAIMASPVRAHFVAELEAQLPGTVPIAWDRHGDRWETGRRALLMYDPTASHHLVVQDDALLCRDFIATARRALVASGPHPVSFYTGATRPHARKVAAAVRLAQTVGAPWIAMRGPLWGVALAIPTADIPALLEWGDEQGHIANYDLRIANYYRTIRQLECWYTVPSLVDHRPVAANPSLVAGRTGNRRAYSFIGSRSTRRIDWSVPPVVGALRAGPTAQHRTSPTDVVVKPATA